VVAAITAGSVAIAVVALVAWLAHGMVRDAGRARDAEVLRATLSAQLRLAQAETETVRAAYVRQIQATRAAQEVAQHAVAQLAALDAGPGVDRLLAALDALGVPAPGPEPSGAVIGGLPVGPGPADPARDPGDAPPSAPVPVADGIADVLR